MELTIRDRIKHVLEEKKYTVTDLLDNKSRQSSYNKQMSGTQKLSVELLLKVLAVFPDISAEYIMRGDSPMMRSDNMAPKIYNSAIGTLHGANKGSQTTTNPSDAVLQAQLDSMKQVLSMKDELLALKDKQINDLTLDKHALQNQVNTLLIKMPGVKL